MTSPPSPVFRLGDLVEVETESIRAVARVREASPGGRLHLAFEMGEYLPWVDTAVQIRHFGGDVAHSCTARILHAGSSTALLQLAQVTAETSATGALGLGAEGRGPFDTVRLGDD